MPCGRYRVLPSKTQSLGRHLRKLIEEYSSTTASLHELAGAGLAVSSSEQPCLTQRPFALLLLYAESPCGTPRSCYMRSCATALRNGLAPVPKYSHGARSALPRLDGASTSRSISGRCDRSFSYFARKVTMSRMLCAPFKFWLQRIAIQSSSRSS